MPSEHSWTSIGAEDEDLIEGGVAGSAAEERAYFKSLYERRKGIRNKGGDQRNKFIKIASLGILTLLLIFNVYFHNHDGKISDIFNFSKSTTDIANTGGIESNEETDDAMSMLSGQSNDDGILYEKPESDINGIKPKRIERISILGERNMKETDLIVNLMNCFPDLEVSTSLNRLGHWFQDESLDTAKPKPTIVIALFLNIYDWVDLMRYNPLNAPMHEGLDWYTFVTTPWAMERPESDLKMLSKKSDNMCQWEFSYDEVIPCFSSMDSMEDPVYELKRDGSGSPFDSIVNLRAEKIRNYLSTSKYPYVQKVMPVKYEDLIKQGGLDELVQAIMRETNIPFKCDLGNMSLKPPRDSALFSQRYAEWLNENAEWDAEKLIGYELGEMIHYDKFNKGSEYGSNTNSNKDSEKDELWSGPDDDLSSFEIKDDSKPTILTNVWGYEESPDKLKQYGSRSDYNSYDDETWNDKDTSKSNMQYGSDVESKSNPDENWYNQELTDKNQQYGSSIESKSNNDMSVQSPYANEDYFFDKTSSSENLGDDFNKPSDVADVPDLWSDKKDDDYSSEIEKVIEFEKEKDKDETTKSKPTDVNEETLWYDQEASAGKEEGSGKESSEVNNESGLEWNDEQASSENEETKSVASESFDAGDFWGEKSSQTNEEDLRFKNEQRSSENEETKSVSVESLDAGDFWGEKPSQINEDSLWLKDEQGSSENEKGSTGTSGSINNEPAKSSDTTDLWGEMYDEQSKSSETSSQNQNVETESESDIWGQELKKESTTPEVPKEESKAASEKEDNPFPKDTSEGDEEPSMIKSVNEGMMEDDFLSEFTGDNADKLTNTIEINKPKVISLLAERNTGLEWLHPKIKNCFPDLAVTTTLTRESPWFQTPPDANQLEPTLAIALFMNPFTWIELMRMNAVHSPNHVNKDWFSFVMAPWTMDRPADDTQVTKCQYEFSYDEVIPCGTIRTDSGDHAVYEMKCREGKCEPYKNIIGLRADKIGNFLSVANWKNVVFMSINYESLTKSTGFSYLLSQIEEKTGAKALCKEEELKAPVPPSKLTGGEKEEFRTWIKDNLNWAPEYDIGYGNTMDEDVWG